MDVSPKIWSEKIGIFKMDQTKFQMLKQYTVKKHFNSQFSKFGNDSKTYILITDKNLIFQGLAIIKRLLILTNHKVFIFCLDGDKETVEFDHFKTLTEHLYLLTEHMSPMKAFKHNIKINPYNPIIF